MIAQPGEWKVVRMGNFRGRSTFGVMSIGPQRSKARMVFSGSPVYDRDGELVGVFCLYDSMQGVALLSPGAKAQQFPCDYDTSVPIQP